MAIPGKKVAEPKPFPPHRLASRPIHENENAPVQHLLSMSCRPLLCDPERTQISCFTALTGDPGCGSLQREPHAADRSRNSRQEIRGRRGICGAPFVCPAPTGPQPPPIITDPYGNTNLSFLIPGFQEWSAEPQIPRLRSGYEQSNQSPQGTTENCPRRGPG